LTIDHSTCLERSRHFLTELLPRAVAAAPLLRAEPSLRLLVDCSAGFVAPWLAMPKARPILAAGPVSLSQPDWPRTAEAWGCHTWASVCRCEGLSEADLAEVSAALRCAKGGSASSSASSADASCAPTARQRPRVCNG
tara:strand:+ start:404 stop:817 length:414 start_codon:yes stop_codon:yes gene_type:complete